MHRALASALVLAALSAPALAVDGSATSVTCAGAVTTKLSTQPEVRDLEPSMLPVLAYKAEPKEREYKRLAKFGDVPVDVLVYRVNEKTLRLQIFEDGPNGPQVLADAPLGTDLSDLTYRPIGADQLVTVYCY